jgi:hypothetical protein
MPSTARRLTPRHEPKPDQETGPAHALRELLTKSRSRRFLARLSDSDAPARDTIHAPDFLQAAISFAETCTTADAREIKVAVTDCETGETHCFALSV